MNVKSGTLAALFVLTALGGCTDPQAQAKAEADVRVMAEKKIAARKMRTAVDNDIRCLNALEWLKKALAGAGIGSIDLYARHYHDRLAKTLGTQVISEAPAPELGTQTIDAYLAWSYPRQVKDVFTAGSDIDQDGTISPKERSNRGFSIVQSCVQFVAEAGKGPLAGKDKVGRMLRIQELRGKLQDKGT
jgi:hypothetical protein